MTPWRARFARGEQLVRCWLGLHEWLAHPQAAQEAAGDAPAQPGILRQRCLHCGALTDGWVQDGPRYAITQPGDRARLVLHNPRVRNCRCAACEKTRAARRVKRGSVSTLRRSA